MKISFFFLLITTLLGTAEAGLRHIYENLFVFLAYRFELENVEDSDRIIGVKCASADQATGRCLPTNPQYKRCVGTATVEAKGGRMTDACSLREFLSHISGSKGARLKGEPYDGEELHDFRNKPLFGAGLENSADFDVDKTAMNMLDKEIGDIQCPPWCKVKDGKFLYLPSLETIAMRVGAIKATMSVEELESNKSLFHRLDTCVDGVITDRRADMSRYLIPHLRKAVKGVHPIAFRSLLGNRQLFLYGKTIQGIRDSVQGTGANAESFFRNRKKILDNAWEEYMGTKRALEHKAPIEKWGVLTARMFPVKGCEQRPAN